MPKKKIPTPPVNPAAAMARKRWARTTPEQRTEIARKLNLARWGKKKKKVRSDSPSEK